MTTKEHRVAEIERGYADRDDCTEAEREITNQFRSLTPIGARELSRPPTKGDSDGSRFILIA